MAKNPYKKDQELLPDPITRQILQFRVVFSALTHFHTLDFTEPQTSEGFWFFLKR